MLNIFYEELEGDRWLLLDRYPRRLVRRLVRGPPQPGGHMRVFLNLCAGLDQIGVRYRINDYRRARKNPAEPACIVGRPHLLDRVEWENPILFGAALYSHPTDDPNLLQRRPIEKILVPGLWMKEMYRPWWDDMVTAWPVGIDTERWRPVDASSKTTDVLLYDKVRWEHEHYEQSLIEPIRACLRARGRSFREIRYGFYREVEFHAALAQCRTMIFLCEHETQGIAYQQALSRGIPILAWDRGGFWQDPAYYPHRVKFAPVTSVPYWDERCGRKFASIEQFEEAWGDFWEAYRGRRFAPRDYILENLTLAQCARQYVDHAQSVAAD